MSRLEYKIYSGLLEEADIDSIIILVGKKDGKPIIPSEAEKYFGETLARVLEIGDFKGEEGESFILYSDKKISRIVLCGLGGEPGYETFMSAIANGINKLSGTKAEKIGIIHNPVDELDKKKLLIHMVNSIELTLYDPGREYKSKKDKKESFKEIVFLGYSEEYRDVLEKAIVIADAVNYARRIADAPASLMNPEKIEEEAVKLAREHGLEIKILHYDDLLKEGLNGIIAVGKGSVVKPRLILLFYRGRGGDEWDLGLVGKTVTFDAGGLDLKTAQGMADMKYDKSGGATVLGIFKAVVELKLPLNVIAALPAVENLPGPTATKPRDIVKMYNGLTIEVGNTDAEGRIILADTLAYIDKNYSPKTIIDYATLTGAIIIALGNYAAGLFTENDELAEKLYRIGLETGEKVWRMPLWKEYYEQLKSDFADINNIGGRPAGSITAAAFLSHFVKDKSKWVHLDIAGTAWVQNGHPKKPYYKRAATGYGVRLTIHYILEELDMI